MNFDLKDHLSTLNARISAASAKSRLSQPVTIIAVTKTHLSETISEALALGLLHIGENKVQEAAAKRQIVGQKGIWHMIGHLQKNKAKVAVRIFDCIDSIDSLELAQTLNTAAAEIGKNLPVLLEVNTSGEGSKFGLKPADAAAVAEKVNALSNLTLNGLMTLAPFYEDPEKTRAPFAALRECRDKIQQSTGLSLPELSMGMSNDFEVAIEEGSTQVRLGTILFGPRLKTKRTDDTLDLP